MSMAILNPEIAGKYSKERKKILTEKQKNTKTEILAKWGPGFYI